MNKWMVTSFARIPCYQIERGDLAVAVGSRLSGWLPGVGRGRWLLSIAGRRWVATAVAAGRQDASVDGRSADDGRVAFLALRGRRRLTGAVDVGVTHRRLSRGDTQSARR